MYAAYFGVRSWLEEPAKWLQWALASVGTKKLPEGKWNLTQFWKSLEGFKAQAKSPQEWHEILTLDARSQLILARYAQAKQSELLQAMSQRAGMASLMWWVPTRIWDWLTNQKDAQIVAWGREAKQLAQVAEQATAKAQELGKQAAKAAAQAKVPADPARRIVKVATVGTQDAALDAETVKRITKNTERPMTAGDVLAELLGSIPWWGWAAAGLALALVLTQGGGSTVVISEARRRTA